MRKYNYSLQKVIRMVKRKRNKVLLNLFGSIQIKVLQISLKIGQQIKNCCIIKQSTGRRSFEKIFIQCKQHRNYTSEKIKKLINQMECIKNTNILLDQLQKNHKFTQLILRLSQQNQIISKIEALQKNINKIKMQIQIQMQQIFQDRLYQSSNKNKSKQISRQITQISRKNNNNQHLSHHNNHQYQETNLNPNDKQIIKNIKIKVFQLQNHKKLVKSYSSYKSQLKVDNNWIQNYKKTGIFLPYANQLLIVQQKNAIQQKLFLFYNVSLILRSYTKIPVLFNNTQKNLTNIIFQNFFVISMLYVIICYMLQFTQLLNNK